MYKLEQPTWQKCWVSDCETSAMVLVQFGRRRSPFRYVWYCNEHTKLMKKQNPTAKILTRIVSDGNGNVTYKGLQIVGLARREQHEKL